ncbi:hypothetical protein EXIGLDRAFT_763215 [Exidia glandulosa HHB12029]|uniref:Uncharacterized protein n=1 Tax=Exidia glandulosa HHB12029 TaxID=1314781 RepID=A0A165M482_EXIGL|nr:hypothetical protein EXIGLDRAFT_763215 [Exidia glandulosa HHB12029]
MQLALVDLRYLFTGGGHEKESKSRILPQRLLTFDPPLLDRSRHNYPTPHDIRAREYTYWRVHNTIASSYLQKLDSISFSHSARSMASTPELAVAAANASLNLHEHPISRLSDDILSYFFESMLDPDPLPDLDGNIWKPAMVVAAVCKHWRLVALSAPSVWRNIIIAPHCPPSHYTH